MDHPAIVRMIYRGILGREPDPDGLAHSLRLLEAGMSVEQLAAGVYGAPEAARTRRDLHSPDRMASAGGILAAGMENELSILDVGAQTLSYEDHIYQPLIEAELVKTLIGFDPLEDKAKARTEAEPLSDIRAVALGTGHPETLHINNVDATSSILAINRDVMGHVEDLFRYETIKSVTIPTTRLDDVPTPPFIDFMKLDIQGYELRVLENALSTLTKTLCIHIEAEFEQLYVDQPLFGDLFNFLLANDFAFFDLRKPVRLSSLEARRALPGIASSRLYWGDAVFLKKIHGDPDRAMRQALVTHFVYGWPDVTFDLLQEKDRLTGSELSAPYARTLSA